MYIKKTLKKLTSEIDVLNSDENKPETDQSKRYLKT